MPRGKRALPKFPRRIGIVTSPAGAVIQDMLNVLSAPFSGAAHTDLSRIWCRARDRSSRSAGDSVSSRESGWAEVVIVARGGGSLEDLVDVQRRGGRACNRGLFGTVDFRRWS